MHDAWCNKRGAQSVNVVVAINGVTWQRHVNMMLRSDLKILLWTSYNKQKPFVWMKVLSYWNPYYHGEEAVGGVLTKRWSCDLTRPIIVPEFQSNGSLCRDPERLKSAWKFEEFSVRFFIRKNSYPFDRLQNCSSLPSTWHFHPNSSTCTTLQTTLHLSIPQSWCPCQWNDFVKIFFEALGYWNLTMR